MFRNSLCRVALTLVCSFLFSGCSSTKFRSSQGVLYQEDRPLVMIDPGHGGKDGGTSSLVYPKVYEKNVALSTSLMLKRYLDQMGIDSTLTRQSDVFIPLKERADKGIRRDAELFVSIHYNAASSRSASGIEIYYYNEGNPKRRESSLNIANRVLLELVKVTGARNRGVKQGNFSVIRNSTSPAILVEAGFLSNSSEFEKIQSVRYQAKIAWAIARSIKLHFTKSL